jgi:uncharacterized protein (DUF924 family)
MRETGGSLTMTETAREVLDFWFSDEAEGYWFEASPAFDQTVRKRFGELFARAVTGELESWESSPEGSLALCILLDQMPRNMFRGAASAFIADQRALAVAERAIRAGFDQSLQPEQKQFLYLPFMHSEVLANQMRALALCEAAKLRDPARHAAKHLQIIRRFGRFPHRNAILGRPSTPEELDFLEESSQAYGQEARAEAGPADGDPPAAAVRDQPLRLKGSNKDPEAEP